MSYFDASRFEAASEFSQRSLVRNLPPKKPDPIAVVLIYNEALFAIVHAKRNGRTALVHPLHSELARAIAGPIFQVSGPNAHIAQ
jgi:hypothetical protein